MTVIYFLLAFTFLIGAYYLPMDRIVPQRLLMAILAMQFAILARIEMGSDKDD